MQDLKIDLVYLWVDGNDKSWELKKQLWFNYLKIADTQNDHCCRYANNDELKYSLRSVQMYAPWINNIFIVTDNQIPNWLDLDNKKIHIINHKEIMPALSLPTFNSEAIETCLDKIPNLSEHFLYANDDMFFSSPVQPSDFFNEEGIPYIDLRERTWEKFDNLHQQNVLYSINTFLKKYKSFDLLMVEPTHCIEAYTKKILAECRNEFKDKFDIAVSNRFRTKNSIQRIIYNLYAIQKNLGVLRIHPPTERQEYNNSVFCLHIDLSTANIMKKRINNLKPKLLCINDCDKTTNEQRKQLKFMLSELFNEKFTYEKQKLDFKISPVFDKKTVVPIVFSFNEKYLKYFAVTLQSIIKNSSKDYYYDIIAFCPNVKQYYKNLLSNMLPSNFSLRFFNILEYVQQNFPDIKLKTTEKWSIDMYYRIFIPLIMPEYEKVLYLDADIIVECNIKEIYDIDLEGNQILAVRDTASQIFTLVQDTLRLEQFEKCLKISNEYDYFNSGVILFNNEIINRNPSNYISRIKHAFDMEIIYCPDQDILNLIFNGVTKLISATWNFCLGTELFWGENYIEMISGDYKKDYIKARENPKIIHYTSSKKPWNSKLDLHFEKFWKYARKNVFYEEILLDMNKEVASRNSQEAIKFQSLYLQLQQGKRIVLWGASIFLEEFITKYEIMSDNIIGIIDKNPQKKGLYIKNYKIYLPEDLKELNPTDIIVTIYNRTYERAKEIKQYLNNNNFENINVRTI